MTDVQSEISSLVTDALRALEREGVVLGIAGVDKFEIPKRIEVELKGDQHYKIMPANDADTILPVFDVGEMFDQRQMKQTVIRPGPQETEVFAFSGHYRIFYRKP